MCPYVLCFGFLFFSGSVVRCQENTDDSPEYQEYLEKCKLHFPDSSEMDVFAYQDYSCEYYCYGSGVNDTTYGDSFLKDNGVKCTDSDREENYECLNGNCYLSVDVAQCLQKQSCIGETTSLTVNECNVTCIGHGQAEVVRPADNFCILWDNWRLPAKCDANGICQGHRQYVTDSSGNSTVNEDAAKSICQSMQPDFQVYVNMMDTYRNIQCDFMCSFESDDEEQKPSPKDEYLTFQNGFTCGESKTCINGNCVIEKDIETCRTSLGEDVKKMTQSECTMTCVGDTKQVNWILPVNTTCFLDADYWYGQEGKCDEDGTCIPDSKDYYDNKNDKVSKEEEQEK